MSTSPQAARILPDASKRDGTVSCETWHRDAFRTWSENASASARAQRLGARGGPLHRLDDLDFELRTDPGAFATEIAEAIV